MDFYLYSIIDIYSRYVVGWLLATAESATLAERLLAETIRKQGVDRGRLTIHADNGSSMASKPVAFLLADLGITKTHSRPHVSNLTRAVLVPWSWPFSASEGVEDLGGGGAGWGGGGEVVAEGVDGDVA